MPRGWITLMKNSLRELAPVYNTARMVQEYTRRFYYPALEKKRLFSQNDYERGKDYAAWLLRLREHWDELQFGEVTSSFNGEVKVGDTLGVTAEVYLGEVAPDDIAVQLYEGALDAEGEIERGRAHNMTLAGAGSNGDGWYRYHVDFVSDGTGRHGYTIRLLPRHVDMRRTLHLGLIHWAR